MTKPQQLHMNHDQWVISVRVKDGELTCDVYTLGGRHTANMAADAVRDAREIFPAAQAEEVTAHVWRYDGGPLTDEPTHQPYHWTFPAGSDQPVYPPFKRESA